MLEPRGEAELAGMLAAAQGPLCIRGGGTRGAFAGGQVIASTGLRGIRLYEPGALTLVVAAGTPLDEVEAVLGESGQRLGFEPPRLGPALGRGGSSTIGGVMAMNASGPRRLQAGSARDAMLGLRMVDGAGVILRNGGRVMKNVTGYDLVKLLAGSAGRLGMITEVALRVQARPEAERTLSLAAPLAEGLALLRAAMQSPYDPTGAAWAGGAAHLRLEGLETSVRARAAALAQRLGGAWQICEGSDSAALWAGIRDAAALVPGEGQLWRVHCRPRFAAEIALGAGDAVVADWAGGALWLRLPRGDDLAARIGDRGSALAVGRLPAGRMAGDEAAQQLRQGVARAFDPRGLFAGGGG